MTPSLVETPRDVHVVHNAQCCTGTVFRESQKEYEPTHRVTVLGRYGNVTKSANCKLC